MLIVAAAAVHPVGERAAQQPPNWSLIEPGLYMGGREIKPPADAQAVLNLSLRPDDYGVGALGRGGVYRWDGIPDGEPAPSVEWLRQQVEFVDAQRSAGLTVFVHCDAGASRSGLVTAAYLMWRDHLSRDEAIDRIRLKRSVILPNRWFLELLLEWEKVVQEEGGARRV